mgnify:FL=1
MKATDNQIIKKAAALLSALCGIITISANLAQAAQTDPDWQNASVVERNRLPMRASFHTDDPLMSLHGLWKFKWYETPDGRSTTFFQPQTDDSDWGEMPVPGIWEVNGYGNPLYVNIGYCWKGQFENNPPYVPVEKNHVGQYRNSFTVPADWNGKQIILHIGSATSNIRVWINGKEVGYSQDSKLEARFDVTRFVKPGEENLFAFEIFRWCDGTYLEDQDFWKLAGIARKTYLTAREKEHIEDINVNADAEGNLSWKVLATKGIKEVIFKIPRLGYSLVLNKPSAVKDGLKVFEGTARFDDVMLWSAETPNLYYVEVIATDGKKSCGTANLMTGFRTVKIEGKLLYVNGKPILIKGVNRHEMNPYGAYVISKEDMLRDIRIMKELNINTVRTCHYPDDPYWYELCDEYGLYVIDEANNEAHGLGYGEGTIAKNPLYNKEITNRVERMMRRDRNHPSIIVWSLGNEAGNGQNFFDAYDFAKAFDPTRPVQYEQGQGGANRDRNSDIFCPMYIRYANAEKYIKNDQDRPFIMCEYAHAMGNSMGGFKEYWDLIRKYSTFQGGCIWDFVDQALYKPADAEKYGTDHVFAFGGDYNSEDPSDASFNNNGLIAPDRIWHRHAYEVRYQHRSILAWASPEEAAKGRVHIFNEYFFIPLDRFSLDWELVRNGVAFRRGSVASLGVQPQDSAAIDLGYKVNPELLKDSDVYLNISFRLNRQDGILPAGTALSYEQIVLSESWIPDAYKSLTLSKRPFEIEFDKETGSLTKYSYFGKNLISAPILPCFGRAVTDNDEGMLVDLSFDKEAKRMFATWRNPEIKATSFEDRQDGDTRIVTVKYKPIEDAIPVLTYRIAPNGVINVTLSIEDAGNLKAAPHFFRVGVEFAMPGEYSQIDFYGEGPFDSYCDRRSSTMIGHYTQSVIDQYDYTVVRPQESGTHCGLKWFSVLNPDGNGIRITSSAKEFSASALPVSRQMLDRHPDFGHSLELKKSAHESDRTDGQTYVNLDLRQMGLGCVSSFGDHPLPAYLIPAVPYTFEFTMTPVWED